jgi:hypothetical protein
MPIMHILKTIMLWSVLGTGPVTNTFTVPVRKFWFVQISHVPLTFTMACTQPIQNALESKLAFSVI